MMIIIKLFVELWLEWIEDEVKVCADDRNAIRKLFDMAVQDYMCKLLRDLFLIITS